MNLFMDGFIAFIGNRMKFFTKNADGYTGTDKIFI